MVTAKDIQADLLTKATALVDEAKALIAEKSKNKLATRLSALGFTRAVGAEHNPALKEAERLEGLVAKHQEQFPGLKFIPDKAMKAICEKYGLLIGQPENFLGDIPEWALSMIEKNAHLIDEWWEEVQTGFTTIIWSIGPSPKRFRKDKTTGELVEEVVPEITVAPQEKVHRTNLRMVADRGLMLLEDSQEVRDHRIVARDPIVCLEVEGGFICLAAWGEEGSDPAILNPLNN